MRATFLVLTCLAISVPAPAQVVEVGAGLSGACIGSEVTACGNETGPMWPIHGSLWVVDRLEIGIRLASVSRPDWTYSMPRDDRFNAVDDLVVRQITRI